MTLPDFSNLHIMVIGDIMIDRYIHGIVERISPEAPVPVIDVKSTEDRLGGAANVCANLIALGSKVTLLTMIGDDEEGTKIQKMLNEVGNLRCVISIIKDRKTTVKARFMSGSQQMLRVDSEDKHDVSQDDLIHSFNECIEATKIDGIIMQDYNKGLLTQSFIKRILEVAQKNNIPTFVDPKEKNFWSYEGCTVFKPNRKEIERAVGHSISLNDDLHSIINARLNNHVTLVTLGKDGIYYGNDQENGIALTKPRYISDVCGAGDTVISVATLCYCMNMQLEELATLANLAGGQVCEIPGVAVIDRTKLCNELNM
jgi:rfaE bifunctional protein kinase chain/domain